MCIYIYIYMWETDLIDFSTGAGAKKYPVGPSTTPYRNTAEPQRKFERLYLGSQPSTCDAPKGHTTFQKSM